LLLVVGVEWSCCWGCCGEGGREGGRERDEILNREGVRCRACALLRPGTIKGEGGAAARLGLGVGGACACVVCARRGRGM